MATPLSRKVCITVSKNNFPVVSQELRDILDEDSFQAILGTVYTDYTENAIIKAQVSDVSQTSHFGVNLRDNVNSVAEFTSVKWIKYTITDVIALEPKKPTKNYPIFEKSSVMKPLDPVQPKDFKERLLNKIIEDMQCHGNILRSGYSQQAGLDAIRLLSNAVWYLDGRRDQVDEARADYGKVIPVIPERYNAQHIN